MLQAVVRFRARSLVQVLRELSGSYLSTCRSGIKCFHFVRGFWEFWKEVWEHYDSSVSLSCVSIFI